MTLLAAAPATAVVLYFLGIRLFTAKFERFSNSAGSGWTANWVGHVQFHWPFFTLLFVALLGLWLLTRSKHDEPRS